MIIGILGMIDDFRPVEFERASPCGNGKTNFLTAYLYQQYQKTNGQRKIITNFHTRFRGSPWGSPSWSTYMSAQEIFDHWNDPANYGALIGITELQSIFNSMARDVKVFKYIERCLQQRRKMGYDLIWDSQRWGSGDRRIRDNTDYLYRPEKWHCRYDDVAQTWVPTDRCPVDTCDVANKHLILVYQEVPKPGTIEEMLKPKLILKSWEIGELYDTHEKMDQEVHYNTAWAAVE